jgi:pseudaminic acid synthase
MSAQKNKRKQSFSSWHRCFIVAEISGNHNQRLDSAVEMIECAHACGVDAVKFQTYTPDTMTIDCANDSFMIDHPQWGGQTLYALYKKAYTPWEWFPELQRVSHKLGLTFFSTAFDRSAVDFLESIDIPFHKIASFELVDLDLIAYAARTKKPLILSTGMATFDEIKEAVGVARNAGAREIMLLKCVSSYPAVPRQMNLATISDMQCRFKCPVGLSDHSLGIGVPLAAVMLGAKMVEKHFVLTRRVTTPDSFFSLEPSELSLLVENIRIAEAARGSINYGITYDERKSRHFRRSLFVVADMNKGDVFTPENVRSIRPANGLAPQYLSDILGKRAACNIVRGTPLTWKVVKR